MRQKRKIYWARQEVTRLFQFLVQICKIEDKLKIFDQILRTQERGKL